MICLKEWAGAIDSFRRGEQLVMIRKGGLIEPGTGFELQSDQFVFYPTFEHQTVNFVREPFRPAFESALGRKPAPGILRIDTCGVAVHSKLVTDPGIITRLEPFHFYNDAFLQQRLKWQPEQPLMVVVVRAYQLPVQEIPLKPHYAGCKSWVELEQPVSLAGARPVLDEAAFEDRLGRIKSILG